MKELNGELVDEAIVARDARAVERLKCKIEYIDRYSRKRQPYRLVCKGGRGRYELR